MAPNQYQPVGQYPPDYTNYQMPEGTPPTNTMPISMPVSMPQMQNQPMTGNLK